MESKKQYILNEIEKLKKFEASVEDVDDLIDGTHEKVRIFEMTFYPSQILKECDEIAYNEVRNELESNQIDMLYEQIEEEIENSDLSEEEKDFLTEELKWCI